MALIICDSCGSTGPAGVKHCIYCGHSTANAKGRPTDSNSSAKDQRIQRKLDKSRQRRIEADEVSRPPSTHTDPVACDASLLRAQDARSDTNEEVKRQHAERMERLSEAEKGRRESKRERNRENKRRMTDHVAAPSKKPKGNLRPCPDCGQDISKKAQTCIHCGCPVGQPESDRQLIPFCAGPCPACGSLKTQDLIRKSQHEAGAITGLIAARLAKAVAGAGRNKCFNCGHTFEFGAHS